MKQSFKSFFIIGMPLFIFVCLPAIVNAQPDPCGDPIDHPCPVDSGLLLLIAIGIAYGIKKIIDARRTRIIQ